MTATDELRRMLDERGIEWSDRSPHPDRQYITDWSRGGFLLAAVERHEGKLELMSDYHCLITPEQVIDVACERTCKQVLIECNDGLMPPFRAYCSACDAEWGYTPNYCPNCGSKVVG